MSDNRRTHIGIGASVYGALPVGVLSLLLAYVAVSRMDRAGAGIALVAGVLAFGLLVDAVLRR